MYNYGTGIKRRSRAVGKKFMEAITCLKTRRSVRKYTEEQIPHDVLEQIVETASYAPSWKNTQVVRYTVVENPEMIEAICKDGLMGFELNQKTVGRAKTLVIVSYVEKRSGYEKDGSYSTSKEDRWEMFDAGIATQTFCLAAHAMGVGSVIMGIFDDAKVAEIIGLDENQTVAAVLAVGYPAFAPDVPPRKEVSKLLTFK